MARRTQLQGICNDLLSTFISRNNDLDGYWALGQCLGWLEEEQAVAIKMSLVGKMEANQKPQVSALSRHFSTALVSMLSRQDLSVEWVKDGCITIERENSHQLRFSLSLISDLGRKFESSRSLAVRQHDPVRELRRETDDAPRRARSGALQF